MGTGIRAEVKVTSPDSCPIAQVTGGANTDSVAISKSVNPDSPSLVTEEFLMEDPLAEAPVEFEQVFSYGENGRIGSLETWGRGVLANSLSATTAQSWTFTRMMATSTSPFTPRAWRFFRR